jgi:hypothetical protein
VFHFGGSEIKSSSPDPDFLFSQYAAPLLSLSHLPLVSVGICPTFSHCLALLLSGQQNLKISTSLINHHHHVKQQ